jgi:hypothetical protein
MMGPKWPSISSWAFQSIAPNVAVDSSMTEDGWIPVNPRTLATKYPNVYAVGDCANNTGAPKAGVFAEGAARAVASDLIAKLRNSGKATQYNGNGACYIEFGGGRIGKVEVDFFSGPKPTGTYHTPSLALPQTRRSSVQAAARDGLGCEAQRSLPQAVRSSSACDELSSARAFSKERPSANYVLSAAVCRRLPAKAFSRRDRHEIPA